MRFAPALLLLSALSACDKPAGDLREWRPEDHDHTTNPGQDQVVGGPDAGSQELARAGLDEVTVTAWGQNCVRCHGHVGRGDGPQGAMFHATDLTNPAWQRAVTDAQIATTIKNGRGAMPPFNLPDGTIKTLVHLIRLLDAGKMAAAAEPDASAAPEPSSRPRTLPSAVPSAAPSAR
jgi:mono/diheme cytochrome c family protein